MYVYIYNYIYIVENVERCAQYLIYIYYTPHLFGIWKYRNQTKFTEIIGWRPYILILMRRNMIPLDIQLTCTNIVFVDLLRESLTAYPIFIFIQSFFEFRILDSKIQMKRAKRLIHAYILTYLLTYLLTYFNYPTLVIESV